MCADQLDEVVVCALTSQKESWIFANQSNGVVVYALTCRIESYICADL